MKSRTTVLLILALVACLAYIVMRPDRQSGDDPNPPAETAEPLLGDAPKPPAVVSITAQSGQKIEFRADDSGWRIAEPISAPAINARVASLVEEIVSIKRLGRYESSDPKAPDAGVTGLAKPRWTVTISGPGSEAVTLRIGQAVPLSGKAKTYVRVSGDQRICIAGGDPSQMLSRPASYYRSPTVLAVDSESIASVRVAGASTYSLMRRPRGRWIISTEGGNAEKFAADGREVGAFLSHLAKVDALAFTDDSPTDLAPYGLGPGGRRLAVSVTYVQSGSDDPISRTLSLGQNTGGDGPEAVYAKLDDQPTVFTLPASMLTELEPDRLALRDKAVLPVKSDAITALEITIDSNTMKLTRAGGKWSITEPKPAPGNQRRLDLLADRLASLRAKNFREEKSSEVQFGFKKPRGAVRIIQAGSGDPVTLTVGAESPAAAVAFVKSSSADAVAAVGSQEVEIFLAPLARYYDPTLWVLPDKTDVSRVAIDRPGGKVELNGSPDGKWRMSKPLDAPVDFENVNAILDQLDSLTATRIVSVGLKTRDYYARGAARITASFEIRPQGAAAEKPGGVFRMAVIEQKVYGWMDDDPLGRVGLFSGRIYRQFAAELRNREILDFDTKSIAGIALAAAGKVMVLQKLDGRWKYSDDPDLKIDSDAVNGYLDHVKTSRALRFVSSDAGAPDEKYGLKKSKAWLTLTLTTSERKTISVTVSRKGSDETANRYASVSGLRGVFTLSAQTAASLARKITDFKQQIIP